MKKSILFVLSGLLFTSMFYGCNDDNELDLSEAMAFSKLSVEQQKLKIETNHNSFADTLDLFSQSSPVKIMEYLSVLLDQSQQHSAAVKTFSENLTKKPSLSVRTAGLQLMDRSTEDLAPGEYVYNATLHSFEKLKDLVDKLLIRFPATATATSNNAVFTLDFSNTGTKSADDGTFYPVKVNCSLAANAVSQILGGFTAKYKADGATDNMKETLVVGEYSFVTSVTNTNKKLKKTFEARIGKALVVKNMDELNGNITKSDLKERKPAGAISKVATSVQVLNMTIVSGTDFFEDLMKDMNLLEAEVLDAKTYAEKKAELLNLYMVCYGYFADQNRKFADIKYFAVENAVGQPSVSYDVVARFVLKDGAEHEIDDIYKAGLNDMADYTNRFLYDNGLISDTGKNE